MKQTSLVTHGFNKYPKTTRRAVFLNEMERIVPWIDIRKLIEPHYSQAGNGRPPLANCSITWIEPILLAQWMVKHFLLNSSIIVSIRILPP